jgi:hypothetical protein
MSLSASEKVGEVVFCGNIPSKVLKVVAERTKGKMTELPTPVTIEKYTPPKKRTRDDTDLPGSMPPPPPPPDSDRRRYKIARTKQNETDDNAILDKIYDEYVTIYDTNDKILGTINKRGKNFLNCFKNSEITFQTVNGVGKFVVVANTSHEIYDEIYEQNERDKAILDTIYVEDVEIYDTNDKILRTINKHEKIFLTYLKNGIIKYQNVNGVDKYVFYPKIYDEVIEFQKVNGEDKYLFHNELLKLQNKNERKIWHV